MIFSNRFALTAMGIATAFCLTGCGDDANATNADNGSMSGSQSMAEPGTIVEVAQEAGDFDTLLAAADAAGLVEALSAEGPLTVFAPTDAAFAALGEETIESLLAQPEALAEILQYHVIAGEVRASAISDGAQVDSLLGPWLTANVDDQGVTIGGATVVTTDIEASNGIIHVIDAVLLPPPSIADLATATPELSTLVTALDAAGLVETLKGEGPFTVFAPTNAAFSALPEGTLESLLGDEEALTNVLLYHVVSGTERAANVVELSSLDMLSGARAAIEQDDGAVRIAGVRITTTDIPARNGVVHLVDAVMLPPSD